MAKKAKAPAEKTVTCPDCGVKYVEGAPHQAFCTRTKETKCAKCGKETKGTDEYVVRCQECGEVFCNECGYQDEWLCDGCKDDEDDGI